MIPVTFYLVLALVIGAFDPTWDTPKKPCDPCRDYMMEQYDEFQCTGQTGAPNFDLASCRKKLGKPAEY